MNRAKQPSARVVTLKRRPVSTYTTVSVFTSNFADNVVVNDEDGNVTLSSSPSQVQSTGLTILSPRSTCFFRFLSFFHQKVTGNRRATFNTIARSAVKSTERNIALLGRRRLNKQFNGPNENDDDLSSVPTTVIINAATIGSCFDARASVAHAVTRILHIVRGARIESAYRFVERFRDSRSAATPGERRLVGKRADQHPMSRVAKSPASSS